MEKTDVNTASAIFFIATAVVLIGGLAIIPTAITTTPAAFADHNNEEGSRTPDRCFNYELANGDSGTGCGLTKEEWRQVMQDCKDWKKSGEATKCSRSQTNHGDPPESGENNYRKVNHANNNHLGV